VGELAVEGVLLLADGEERAGGGDDGAGGRERARRDGDAAQEGRQERQSPERVLGVGELRLHPPGADGMSDAVPRGAQPKGLDAAQKQKKGVCHI
jgi:hypothetical protein